LFRIPTTSKSHFHQQLHGSLAAGIPAKVAARFYDKVQNPPEIKNKFISL